MLTAAEIEAGERSTRTTSLGRQGAGTRTSTVRSGSGPNGLGDELLVLGKERELRAKSRRGSAYWALSRGTQSGLAPFRPSIVFVDGDDESVTTGPHPGHLRRDGIPLYAILCLELFNHIAEHAPVYKTCQNETCGRLFVRQSRRALHRQHRTQGVKFCSSECARAQAQRQYRRRKAKKDT